MKRVAYDNSAKLKLFEGQFEGHHLEQFEGHYLEAHVHDSMHI